MPGSKSVSISCRVSQWGLEPIYSAAYSLMDRAYASLSGNPKTSITVRLELKTPDTKGLAPLKKLFLEELATQKLRWSIAKSNQSLREYVTELAVRKAQAPAMQETSGVGALSDSERLEIEKLIAEVETEIQQRGKKTDPLGIGATWEEKHAASAKKS